MSYLAFLGRKAQLDGDHGFEPVWMPDFLFPFQQQLVEWATRKGRAALFADCGLGKTPMQLTWAAVDTTAYCEMLRAAGVEPLYRPMGPRLWEGDQA